MYVFVRGEGCMPRGFSWTAGQQVKLEGMSPPSPNPRETPLLLLFNSSAVAAARGPHTCLVDLEVR